jgi:glycosyltransferase involved in cell wall biosynthesis
MKLVAVTRYGNEADIAEALVRHTCAFVDHHILMADGSIDATTSILERLRDSGLPLTLIEANQVAFGEVATLTMLYRRAVAAGADWVVFLDADEFLDVRGLGGASLKEYLTGLAATRPEIACLKLRLAEYVATSKDDPTDSVVPRRMGWRRAPTANAKVMVRGDLPAGAVEIQPGGHAVNLAGGLECPYHLETGLLSAHYGERSVYQMLAKSAIGWAKVLAAGEAAVARGWSWHYRTPFELLVQRPGDLLRNPHFMGFRHESEDLVYDPIAYRGGELMFTPPIDYPVSAVQTVMNYLCNLATEHGRLVERLAAPRPAPAPPAPDVAQAAADPPPVPEPEPPKVMPAPSHPRGFHMPPFVGPTGLR